jgi:hypothetical protein
MRALVDFDVNSVFTMVKQVCRVAGEQRVAPASPKSPGLATLGFLTSFTASLRATSQVNLKRLCLGRFIN